MFNSQGPVGRSCGKSAAKESMEATDSASLGKEDSSDSLSASVSSPAPGAVCGSNKKNIIPSMMGGSGR